MCQVVGGGEVVIFFNVKLGILGIVIDLLFGYKDNFWLFDYFDIMIVMVVDVFLSDEIVMCLVYVDGGCLLLRCGGGLV